MDKVRFGMVGTGKMGQSHLWRAKEMAEIDLVGICDANEELARDVAKQVGCKHFKDHKELISKENIDAVMVVTPHYYHPDITIRALEQGVHVLCEKPIAVHVQDAERMLEVYKDRQDVLFGLVFQERLKPVWQKLKSLISTGELGKILRVSWTVTAYRTNQYYKVAGWRGTWDGEGGGVLMNQAPHYLDLLQWFFGMPEEVFAVCNFGRFHDIETEDEVIATLKYSDGAVATFITSTGEYPDTDRMQINCERGKVVVENDTITFERTTESLVDFTKTTPDAWSTPEIWKAEVPVVGPVPGHLGILQNFIHAVQGKCKLTATGPEGIHSVMLANAMVYSGFHNKPVKLPLDGKKYTTFLNKMCNKHKPV